MSGRDDDISPYLRRRLRSLAELRNEMARRLKRSAGAERPASESGQSPEPGEAADRDSSASGEDEA